MLNDRCILVDPEDMAIRSSSKLDTHLANGKASSDLPLHRAFSLFLFDKDDRMLLQRRSKHKLTFPLQWTNACCSHPLWLNGLEEPVLDATVRKAKHELGLDLNKDGLVHSGRIIYHALDPLGKYGEHERTSSVKFIDVYVYLVDHLVFGQSSAEQIEKFNDEEVDSVKWVDSSGLKDWIESEPAEFTPWFRMIYQHFLSRPEIWQACSSLDRCSISRLLPHDTIVKLN